MAEKKVFEIELKGVDKEIERLVELQDEIKKTNAELKDLAKTEAKGEEKTEQATAKRAELTKQLIEQKTEMKALSAAINNQAKAQSLLNKENNAAEGSIEQLSLQLSRLKKEYRELSKEERKGAKGKELLDKIQATDREVKSLNMSMGDYRDNVGNYKSATEALGSAFTKVAGIVGGVVVAFRGFETVLNSTQQVGDQYAIVVGKAKSATDLFTRSLLTEGLSFFSRNLKEVTQAAENYIRVMDEAFEIDNSIALIETKNRGALLDLELTMKNTTLTMEERNAAYQEWKKLAAEPYALKEAAALERLDATLENYAAGVGLAEGFERDATGRLTEAGREAFEKVKKEIDDLVTNYAKLSEAEKDAMNEVANLYRTINQPINANYGVARGMGSADLTGVSQTQWENATKALAKYSEEAQRAGRIWAAYNISNDEQVQELTRAIITYEESIFALKEENKRIFSQGNVLEGGVAVPIGLDTPAEVVKQFEEEYFATKPMIEQSLSASPIAIPLAPLVDATANLADMLSQRTYGELGIDNLWVKLLGLDNTLYSEEINAQIEEYSTMLKEGIANIGTEAWGAYLTAREESIDREMELEKKKNDALADSEKKALEGRLAQGLISQKKYEKELAKIDEERAAKEEALEREAFNRKKRLNVSDALMKGALALLDVWKNYAGDPIGLAIQLALTAAGTGVQVAAIRNQKFAKGGRIVGASHAQGGVKGWLAGQNIELEGGEVVINKRSAALFGEELSAINSYNGYGRKFARGGVLGTEKYMPAPIPSLGGGGFNYKDLGEAINTAIDSKLQTLRVVVTEGDITTAQHNVLRAQVAAEF